MQGALAVMARHGTLAANACLADRDFDKQRAALMRKLLVAAAAAMAFSGLAACESKQDRVAEKKADALESQAAATSNEAKETALNKQADQIEQRAGNADGGATTANTPTTK